MAVKNDKENSDDQNNVPVAGAEPITDWPEEDKSSEASEQAEEQADESERSDKEEKTPQKGSKHKEKQKPSKKPAAAAVKHNSKKHNAKIHKKHESGSSEIHTHKRKGKNKAMLWIILAVLFVAILGAAYYFYAKSHPKDTVALVNGEKISVVQLQSNYDSMANAYLQSYGVVPAFVTPEATLNDTIKMRLLVQDTKNKGYLIDKASAEGLLKEALNARKIDPKVIEEQQGKTWDELVVDYQEQFSVYYMLNETIIKDISVTPEEISLYYDQNKEQFLSPEQVHAFHVLICFEGTTGCSQNRTEDSAVTIMTGLLDRVKNGEDIKSIAYNFSDDPSAKYNNGDLGWFTRGKMVPEFEDAAFSTEIGNVSFVKSAFGYHIIKVVGKQNESTFSLNEVSTEIESTLLAQKQQAVALQYVNLLTVNANITVYKDNVARIKLANSSVTATSALAVKNISIE